MGRIPPEETSAVPFVVCGVARLPRSVGGGESRVLMVELVLDTRDGPILDIATTMSLPGYTTLLRRLFLGRSLDGVQEAAQQLCLHYRGPLLRPTIAALANAVANSRNHAEGSGGS